jgi:preprotein translocase subunit SecY
MLYLPTLIVQLVTPAGGGLPPGWAQWVSANFTEGNDPIYVLVYALLIVFFTYFYVSITFNPVDIADDMKKYGGFIPGIRAGRPTAEYLEYVISRITFPGSLYLALIATFPLVVFQSLAVGANFIFGGTSILIIVGVGLDTVKQIESQLQQRNYEGFLR